MADLRELEELKDTSGGSSSSTSTGSSRRGPPGLPSSDAAPPMPGDGPGISITKTSKVGDQLVVRYGNT
jgi:hypothetical protein